MPTTVTVNEELVREARRVGGHESESQTLDAALAEYIQRHRRLGILELQGKVEYEPDYNYKALRERPAL
ncbi:MAG: hypothetical protein AUJ96_11975 [Armatimonadetes bacterium CG2_30_66_41]|nr:type II toxin-antitoxin system CcdA family antitoxin [Armatimonadota bacterium]OIP04777.1 MAG: hypothetical protein AUJ96_11975 [Armatimonadetes bacterium CG2_30_66_41]NCO94617.1 type II toxin-antitoxin system CcdA family antitoxin [Armatimonadota bacterium]NCP32772.1 type II toxin-antitoxin system CcdA family antitoxin [Armatimonadota bacterium]NCQ28088.1 type II toxin-antitoxin system CcdA family antitoxin [Armatimonadota bacterium]